MNSGLSKGYPQSQTKDGMERAYGHALQTRASMGVLAALASRVLRNNELIKQKYTQTGIYNPV